MNASGKAIPVATERDRPYWDGAKEGKLVLQQCKECGLYSAQPRLVCPRCRGEAFVWSEVSGRGKIHSYTIVRQSTAPGFQDEVPYVVVHVQIEEEPTCYITANLLLAEEEFSTLSVDQPVVVEFEKRGDAVLPQFRPAAS